HALPIFSDETMDLITKARDLLQNDLARQQEKYTDFRRDAPLLWKGKEGSSPHQEKLASIEAKRATLVVRQAEILGRLTAIERGLKEGRSRPALLAILTEVPTSSAGETAK